VLGNPPQWRFSLEDLDAGRRHGFGTLQELLAFLERQIAETAIRAAGDQTKG
jgi:hypothetical protein